MGSIFLSSQSAASRSNRGATMTGIADIREMKARIIVCGVGGAGGNAVNNMIEAGLRRRRLHRRQYRRAGAHQFEGRARHPDGHPGDRRPWRRRAARHRARGGGRDHRCDPRAIGRRPHGVHHGRHGRRYRHRRSPRHRQGRARARHSHHRCRHQAIPVRGPAPHALCRSRHRGAVEGGGHASDHPEPEPVPGRQREDHVRRCLRHGRSGALFGCGLHQRPHRQGRPDQSRFCRRSLGHAREGQGHDGQGRGFRRRSACSTPLWPRFPIH